MRTPFEKNNQKYYSWLLHLLCGRPNRPHYWSRPSVCPPVCPVLATNRKQKKRRKTKVGVNVSNGRCNRCANVQFKRSNVKVIDVKNLNNMKHIWCLVDSVMFGCGSGASAAQAPTANKVYALLGPACCRRLRWTAALMSAQGGDTFAC